MLKTNAHKEEKSTEKNLINDLEYTYKSTPLNLLKDFAANDFNDNVEPEPM